MLNAFDASAAAARTVVIDRRVVFMAAMEIRPRAKALL